jgi:hypothetical protein
MNQGSTSQPLLLQLDYNDPELAYYPYSSSVNNSNPLHTLPAHMVQQQQPIQVANISQLQTAQDNVQSSISNTDIQRDSPCGTSQSTTTASTRGVRWKWVQCEGRDEDTHLSIVSNIFKKKDRPYDQYVCKLSYLPK